ncbi:hypothetical protein PV05_11798 [Exophiala xenobiotica]|uniref:BZIP domain-containing protein n=1 Tax=Exophiala xenobiotica TaxID=348802 RepID=A0A0D2E615_9EURO|nr:uncharacterized protein PV05_11798 [Exophiala xenobiotica]KIW50185.1 hypothetical protein PV05_11798 [Exophiala xenobiotica]
MAPTHSSPPPATRTKQERIRDNQRRSRARRAEYLAELERRLNECHAVCREAEMQRVAFADLQAENARLRSLLNTAGISRDVADPLRRKNIHSHGDYIAAASNRQIKPKFQHTDSGQRYSLCNQSMQQYHGIPCSTAFSPSYCTPQANINPEAFHSYDAHYTCPLTSAQPTLVATPPQTNDPSPMPSYDWLFGSDAGGSGTSSHNGLSCDTFHVPQTATLVPDDCNTVPCSGAKSMIEQYDSTSLEMEEIKTRLATAFSPNTGSRLNTQVLFRVLNDMNARQAQEGYLTSQT